MFRFLVISVWSVSALDISATKVMESLKQLTSQETPSLINKSPLPHFLYIYLVLWPFGPNTLRLLDFQSTLLKAIHTTYLNDHQLFLFPSCDSVLRCFGHRTFRPLVVLPWNNSVLDIFASNELTPTTYSSFNHEKQRSLTAYTPHVGTDKCGHG